jgi:hypothetical protein
MALDLVGDCTRLYKPTDKKKKKVQNHEDYSLRIYDAHWILPAITNGPNIV